MFKVDESIGAPALEFTKTVELDPKDAINNKKEVNVFIDGEKYISYQFDFTNRTVTRTYINSFYVVKYSGELVVQSEPSDTSIYDPSDINENVYNFILNTSTKKIHTHECATAQRIKDENRQEVTVTAKSLTEAISKLETMGYVEYELCKKC